MPTVTPTAARDQVAPALHKAQETLTDTVIPTVREAIATAFEKSGEILDSDVAWEARRRGTAIVKAARGDTAFVTPTPRRWRFGLGMIGIGTGLGFGIAWLMKKMSTPVESYQSTPTTIPVPSGTDGGTDTGAGAGTTTMTGTSTTSNGSAPATSDTSIEDIDLTSGARTNL